MKGWVYVMSNPAMPGIVKIGYSTKDPELRAEELNHTGNPHKYLVEYDLLIDEPFLIEQRAHSALNHVNEGKEWFRCSVEDAVIVIQRVANGRGLVETYKHADKKKILDKLEADHKAQRKREELERQEAERKRETAKEKRQYSEEEDKYYAKLAAVNHRYRKLLLNTRKDVEKPFLLYWLTATLVFSIIILAISTRENAERSLVLILAFGFISFYPISFVIKYNEKKWQSSTEYNKLIADRDREETKLTAEFEDWKIGNLKYYTVK